MRQPEPYRDPEAFLSALADDLVAEPDASSAACHVTTAALAARSAHLAGRARAVRVAVVAAILGTVLGTGGVALGGGLPTPIQEVVADVARVLPVPVPVPYPEGAVGTAPVSEPAIARPPEEGAAETAEPEPTRSEPSSLGPVPAAWDERREQRPGCGEHREAGGASSGCELDGDDGSRSWREQAAARVNRRSDADDDEEGAGSREGGGEGRAHRGDRDDEEHRDHQEGEHDEEEERHQDEVDDDRSSNDEKPDGNDRPTPDEEA